MTALAIWGVVKLILVGIIVYRLIEQTCEWEGFEPYNPFKK